jgi:lipopolysaccharide transport system permease protein
MEETNLIKTKVIDANTRWWTMDWRELWRYRDLFFFLVWRDLKAKYAQSVLGVGWTIIKPVFSMLVFTIVFGELAKVDSDGMPYAIFSYTALVPWTYFSGALTSASESLLNARQMITKVYFPRLVIPVAPVLGRLIDFGISFLILFLLMAIFRVKPTIWILVSPLLILVMMCAATGMGMWLTALAIQYRDIQFGFTFFVQLMMYASPVVYPTSSVPEPYRLVYAINPMVGVIEGFRSAFLRSSTMPWDLILVGAGISILLLISGAIYFRYMERVFADVA